MFLQSDKPSATLTRDSVSTRDRASRVLFDNNEFTETAMQDTSVGTGFSFDHNVSEFNNLVQTKYPQMVEFPAPANSTESLELSKYYTDNINTPYQQSTAPVQQYYNDANPIPKQVYQSFRPKVVTDDEAFYFGNKSHADEALMQKIDEVQVFEPTLEKVDFAADVERDTHTESYLKLNTKGVIACLTFAAITLLIIALVIINSVSIGNSNNQIRRLREENIQLTQQYNDAESLRAQAYDRGVTKAKNFAGSPESTVPTIENLPPVSSQPLYPANPDKSTNVFDQIVKFFGKIFS